jgi:deferrochelatase/peroxidase EfeB
VAGGRVGRRAFLGGLAAGAGVAGAAGVGAAVAGRGAPEPATHTGPAGREPAFLAFEGVHQGGIAARHATFGLAAAVRCLAADRDELAETFQALTATARDLMNGTPPEQRGPNFPPTDSGLLGAEPPPADLSVVVSVGASLFDDRYGLADRRPRELVQMPFLANDRLDPDLSHGDLLLSVSAGRPDAVQFALRQLLRATRSTLVLRWMVDGFNRGDPPIDATRQTDSARNLMGFKDGTANLDGDDAGTMDRYVWVAEDDGEPDWALGGSYHVVRLIRMFVEFWDRTPLGEQERIMGRHKATGAPLGGDDELDPVDFDADPEGDVTPLDAHIRLANPRTPGTEGSRILRRGFNYTRGFDDAGRLDQGLAFVSYQRSLERGFLAVQSRLNGEPLEEYILPVGGGFFFALPGVTTPDGWLGESLLS